MPRRRADIVLEKAQLDLAHREDPDAREVKRQGIEVGKSVWYHVDMVKHHGVVSALHHKSVEIVVTGDRLGEKYADLVLRRDTIPYSGVLEVLGDGRLPMKGPPVAQKLSMPPPLREKGYDNCDIARCDERPIIAYLVRSFDKETKELSDPRIVALCKEHDEKYDEPSEPNKYGIMQREAHIPVLWQMGVVSDSWKIPPPEGEKVEVPIHVPPPPKLKKAATVNAVDGPLTDSPYEGVRGRHPRLCDCSRHQA
jgi:hypothetical protein